MGRVVSVEARTVAVPLEVPTAFATRVIRRRHYTLVRIRDQDGAEGVGFCYSGHAGGQLGSLAVRELIGPVLVGQDPLRVRGLWDEAYRETLLHGRSGIVMRALSATDIALWDLNSRTAGLPLWQYLGAVTDQPVPAYASGGYYLPDKGPEGLAEEMSSYLAMGFDAVKMKVGRATPAEDADRLAAVRDTVGPEARIMLDANNAWRDLPSALHALRKLEPYQPYWIEEPFSPDDIDNHARLARETPVLVATGEIEAGRWRHHALLEAGAAAVLQTDAAVCGGITEYQRIAATADSHGIIMCPHAFHDLHIHLVAATPNARYVEYFPNDDIVKFSHLLDRQLVPTGDGHLELPTTVGLGFDFDAGSVDRYAMESWA